MEISCTYTTIITANILFTLLLVPVLLHIKRQGNLFAKKEVKIILSFFLLAIIRLFTPFEFSITHTIGIANIYANLCEFLRETKIANINIMIILCAIEFCGIVVISIVKLLQYRRFSQLISHGKILRYINAKNVFGKTIKIPIKQIKYINEAFITGLLHPVIIIPETLNEKEDYVIQHELQHFKNHDLWYKVVADILCVIYWWNPLIYILKRYIENTLELRNDFSVTETMTEKEKINYAETIVSYMREKNTMNVGLGFNKSLSQTRIYSLFYEKTRKSVKFYSIVMIFTLCSFFIVLEPDSDPNLGNSFSLDYSNSYFVKEKNGYRIYSVGEFVGVIDEIPREFSEFEIFELGEEISYKKKINILLSKISKCIGVEFF